MPQEAVTTRTSSPSSFAPEGADALSGVDLRAHESGLRGPVGGCGFGDVGETDAVLKRKTMVKVKFGGGFPAGGTLLRRGGAEQSVPPSIPHVPAIHEIVKPGRRTALISRHRFALLIRQRFS